NETVTYCIDASSSCSTGQTLGTDTVPAAGGTKTTSSITIPSGLSVGSHTVFAIGGSDSVPSVTVNVTAGAATQLVFTTSPGGSITGGTTFPNQPVVKIQHAHGNTAT